MNAQVWKFQQVNLGDEVDLLCLLYPSPQLGREAVGMGSRERLGQPSMVLVSLPPVELILAICGLIDTMARALPYMETVLSQENICI